MSDISQRKEDHLDLAIRGDVGFKETTTLFECVRLVHDALPELAFDELDTSLHLLGKRLRAPILIAGMTGGTERARRVNRELASIAQERGYAFGLGSQRAMQKNPDVASSYQVREVAPDVLLLGNIGVVQAAKATTSEIEGLVHSVEADALCVHLNPAMELVQADGDRDFRGALAAIERLVRELSVPVVAKETGSGLSRGVGRRLFAAGVRHVDVSGAGGTSWVAVETHRAPDERRGLGQTFWEWGIPTAASVAQVSDLGLSTVFATGGIQSGLDVAKAIALGASAGGIARPVLQAFENGGRAGAVAFLERVENELRMAMLLTGSRDLAALRTAPRTIAEPLRGWLSPAAAPSAG
ncbi:MAG: type 2 isopentenyl-diphosphate Delta-isomerase [Myxococcales bacterium]|nr:type 2 isopentenyl-diphosphate Delta-isomerase [Myxococcales bacterium]MCB9578061.1 type 2 isopentenyl-diphosphate Delta-isomerase [Polyangiaceae bacterium]